MCRPWPVLLPWGKSPDFGQGVSSGGGGGVGAGAAWLARAEGEQVFSVGPEN